MPFQRRIVRPLFRRIRDLYGAIVQVIVDHTIVELVPDLRTDTESKVRRHGDVALIEEPMDIAPHKDAVLHLVRLELRKRAYVGRVERRQRFLAGDRAAAAIRVHDHERERALSQTRQV